MDLKALKAELRKKTEKDPDKYYPTRVLKEKGFHREKCTKCKRYFWTANSDKFCGNTSCSGGYSFIGNSPTKEKMDFIQVWEKFSKLFEKLGYTPIKRYPTVARWRADVYWTNASIYDFQPHVVSGAVEPPANPLVVPQPCIRFNDIDNVGITGSHYTSFIMIGQHAFQPPEKYNTEQYLLDIFEWLEKGMGLPKNELKFHEDQWGGGGNLGVSMEFMCRGLEIGNQVYMTYEITNSGYKDLNLKVLDMGMGQERPAWLTHATDTSYEANMPTAVNKLYNITGIKPQENILRKFLPYSGLLNLDEIENPDKVWSEIAKKLGMGVKELQDQVLPLAALYAIADHSRTLLFAISDGAIPSNVGGCYNLRVLLRRALDYMETYDWNIDLLEICETHAKYMKPQYPELLENLEEIGKILEVEKNKHEQTREKSKRLVEQLVQKEVPEQKLLELYDSQGISPEFLQEQAKKIKKKIDIPDDFYAKVAARHPEVEKKAIVEKKFDLNKLPDTEKLYYSEPEKLSFKARVLGVFDKTHVVLDKTAFYPTGGGRLFDIGSLNGIKVKEVYKVGNVVLHELEKSGLKKAQEVEGIVDKSRRLALNKNHTAAHILGGAARKVLGKHIWQAGSQIEPEKGRLDLTHYESIKPEELAKIEELANKVVKENRKVIKKFMDRNEAEQKYGFTLYQGGAVPGKEIRVVNIENWDVQACGGVHLESTGETEGIKILKTEKIQDGVVRLVFVAGKEKLGKIEKAGKGISSSIQNLVKKYAVLKEITQTDLELSAQTLRVPKEQLEKTLKRFIEESEMFAKKAGKKLELKAQDLPDFSKKLFELWKSLKKELSGAEAQEIDKLANDMLAKKQKIAGIELVYSEVPDFSIAIRIGNKLVAENKNIVVLLTSKERAVCFSNTKTSAKNLLKKLLPGSEVKGDEKRAISSKPLSLKTAIDKVEKYIR